MCRQPRRAFALIDLLAVAVLLCILLALVPACMSNYKIRSRRGICSNNIRNLGQAITSYESRKGKYPGYLNPLKKIDNTTLFTTPGTTTPQGVSWAIKIMPWLELDSVYTTLRSTTAGGNGTVGARDGLTRIELFICPDNPPPMLKGTFLSYVANAGCPDTQTVDATTPRDWADNGVFFDHYTDDPTVNPAAVAPIVTMSANQITDGPAHTLMLSENVDAGPYDSYVEELLAFTWDAVVVSNATTSPPQAMPLRPERHINRDVGGRAVQASWNHYQPPSGGVNTPTSLAHYARPSSNHPGGVNVVYCDSHTSFLSDNIDYYVYGLLMSTSGSDVKQPGQHQVVPHWNRKIQDDWLKQ